MITSISRTPFEKADFIEEVEGGCTCRYATGINNSGTGHHEVLQRVRHPDGKEHTYVIIRGLSRAKTEAITMILNAPEV